MTLSTMTTAVVCSCPADNSERQSLSEFLSCPLLYTDQPYPFHCVHSQYAVGTDSKPIAWSSRKRARMGPVSTPPSPRLVGIETNPGPNRKRAQAKKAVLIGPLPRGASVIAASAAPKRRKPRNRRPGGNPLLQRFLASAINPIGAVPPRLGYDVFTHTGQEILWSRHFGLVTGSANAAFVFNPRTTAGVAGAFGTSNQSWCKTIASSNVNATLGDAGNTFGYILPTDTSFFVTEADTYRPITAAVRVNVRYPSTERPGRLLATVIHDSDEAMAAKTFNDLAVLDSSQGAPTDGQGVSAIQGNFRQSDVRDFEFNNANAQLILGNQNTSKVLVVAVGWSANTTFDLDCVAHVEYQSGSLVSGNAESADQTLALSTSMEQLGVIVRKLPAVLGLAEIRACQLMALKSGMMRSQSRQASRSRLGVQRAPASASRAAMPNAFATEDYIDVTSTGSGIGATSYMEQATTLTNAGIAATALAAAAANAYRMHRGPAN